MYALKAICGISWEVKGIENIPEGPCIFAANHQGVWESFFLQTINIPTSSIIKRELLFIPFFGWALACLKPIHLRRSNKFKSLKTVIIKGSKKLSNN
ncbi:MAG: lysophospholipid acyltransferase family protein, partial [Pseudomonadota bacterium]|nr:lysophospholipid acyltransferase family protein [Pseudomonadota bacterium]